MQWCTSSSYIAPEKLKFPAKKIVENFLGKLYCSKFSICEPQRRVLLNAGEKQSFFVG